MEGTAPTDRIANPAKACFDPEPKYKQAANRVFSLERLHAENPRLIVGGNASGQWEHQLDSNQLWLRSVTVSGFNAGAYLPAHPQFVRPALEAARQAVAAGLSATEVDVLPFSAAVTAHERMQDRSLNGRIVLRATR